MSGEETKQEIISTYLDIVEISGVIPTYSHFIFKGVKKSKIKYHFGNIESLHEFMHNEYQEEIDEYIVTEHTVFTELKKAELEKDIKDTNIFVVTSVVSGHEVHEGFYNSIMNYCKIRNAKLLIIPVLESASRKTYNDYNFPLTLKNESFISTDTKLNENLFISSVMIGAKNIQPTVSMGRIGQRNGSYIIGSPKQSLEFVVNSPDSDASPHAIISTGSMTLAKYTSNKYMSNRTSYIATNDHVIGAIVVEIQNDKKFHFRQIQSDDEGNFCDLGYMYTPTKKNEVHPTLVMGDLHAGDHDETVIEKTREIAFECGVKNIFVHDAFSGYSINHHEKKKPVMRAIKHIQNRSSLEEEISIGVELFKELLSWLPDEGKIFRVKGNHDEWFENYLINYDFKDDYVNQPYAVKFVGGLYEGKDPIEAAFAIADNATDEILDRIVWLQRDSRLKICGIEMAQHGDLGLNGSKGATTTIEKAYGNVVVGHSHTAKIIRGVYQVGTSTKLDLGYNKGPSSWTHTHCLVYETGHRQLIHIIDGDWRI